MLREEVSELSTICTAFTV